MSCNDCAQLRKDVAEALRVGGEKAGYYADGTTCHIALYEAADSLDPKPEPLKACPVCGKQPTLINAGDPGTYYTCHHYASAFENFGVLATPGYGPEPEARRMWNTLQGSKP